MPQRVNAKSDIGNTKVASDVYDVNNCFLTDQGWVYRHWKGNPVNTDRYWDEILVAGQVDPDYHAGADSSNVEPTPYTLYGSDKYPTTLTVGQYEVNGGDPDTYFDIEYSKHDGYGDPGNYKFDLLRDTNGYVYPPDFPQYPENN